jgi:UDP-glucose 4-epimerase
VAAANVAATTWPVPSVASIDDLAFNVGTGEETSVNTLAGTLLEASGGHGEIDHAAARPGELRRSSVAWARAREHLGWHPVVSLAEGLKRTFEWLAEVAV